MPGKTLVNKLLFACALPLSVAFGGQAHAQRQPPFDALEGLDPVMLVQGKEAQGELNITVTRGQFRYMFANAANKAAFEQDPARYEIQLEGHCARMGAPTGGIPDLFTVYQGRIYLFGSGECKKQFEASPQRFFEPERKSAAAAATPAAIEKGRALVEQAVAAVGGAQLLDGLSSYQEKIIVTPEVDYGYTLAFPDQARKDRRYGNYQDAAVLKQNFSDFRAVDGLTLPFKVTTSFNGQPWPQQTLTVESIVINGKLDPALFAKPAANRAATP